MKKNKYILIISGLLLFYLLGNNSLQGQTIVNQDDSFIFYSISQPAQEKVKERELTICIGDSASVKTLPVMEILLWGGECRFGLNLLESSGDSRLVTDSNFTYEKEVVGLIDNNYEHRLFPIDSTGFEWEFVLYENPHQNTFMFNFSSENLDFIFQDSLSDVEKEFCERPDSVFNSYAVYHASKRDNIKTISATETIAANYGSGKAFHIYRPKAWDTKGDTIWCELNIDTVNNLLTITVDSLFLESALYPVVVDPTIGYTTMGSSFYTFSDYGKTALWLFPETMSGNAVLDSAFLGVQNEIPGIGKDKYSVAVYDFDGADSNNCNYVSDVLWEKRPVDGTEWKKAAMNGDTLFADSAYIVAFATENNNFDGNLRVMYDTYGGWGDTKYIGGQPDMTWPSTLGGFSDTFGFRFSVYIVYTIETYFFPRRRKLSNQ